MFAQARRVQQFGIIILVNHQSAAPRKAVALAVGVKQVDQGSLGLQYIVVRLLRHTFPQLQGMGIKPGIARQKVIGARNRGIAPEVAADNESTMCGFRFGIAPSRGPALLANAPFLDHKKSEIAHYHPDLRLPQAIARRRQMKSQLFTHSVSASSARMVAGAVGVI